MKNKTYDELVEKFKPKKTTDDCMTPPQVYDVVRDWACREYNINPERIVRPFWPGGDYENFDYPDGCVVLDNPPFSIISKICEFYIDHKIKFFLFAPALTIFSGIKILKHTNHILCDASITYENGAVVNTGFITNLTEEVVAQTAPELGDVIKNTCKMLRQKERIELPKFEYPDHVVTSAMLGKYAKYGVHLKIKKEDCTFISRLDSQRKHKKVIFGGGLLLSDTAAAERAAAERAAAERAAAERMMSSKCMTYTWHLSERERQIIKDMEYRGE